MTYLIILQTSVNVPKSFPQRAKVLAHDPYVTLVVKPGVSSRCSGRQEHTAYPNEELIMKLVIDDMNLEAAKMLCIVETGSDCALLVLVVGTLAVSNAPTASLLPFAADK